MLGRLSLSEACGNPELTNSLPIEWPAPTFGGYPNPVEVAC